MTKLRSVCRIAALFLLLIAIVIIPERVLAHSAAASLSELFAHRVSAWELNSHRYTELDIWQKIELLNEADTVVQLSEFYDLNSDDELLGQLQTQLLLLQKYAALPGLPAEPLSATALQKRYISAAAPQQAVTVWVICAEYNSCSLFAYLDAENYAVYDIYLNTTPGYGFELLEDNAAQGYIDYICSFAATAPQQLSINASYSMEKVYLSLILGHEQDGLVDGYSFSISNGLSEYAP